MGKTGKTFVLILTLILFASLIVMSPVTVKAQTRTLIVPDQFSTIADAVGNATAGDTVYVKDGSYGIYELGINVPLTLVGENTQKTILLSSSWYSVGLSSAIEITANDVTVENFTIIGLTHISASLGNSPELVGILLQTYNDSGSQPSNCKIIDNTVINNYATGIYVSGDSEKNLISGNNVTENLGEGIYLGSSNSIIEGNEVSKNNGTGIVIDSCQKVTVKQNHISNNLGGLDIRYYGSFNIYQNNITNNNSFGVQFGENCSDSAVHTNNIIENQIGVDLLNYASSSFGMGSKVYDNNLVNNSMNAFVEHALSFNPSHSSNGTDAVLWDNGKTGNFWSDYSDHGYYVIDQNNVDHHPLTQPVNISIATPKLLIESWFQALIIGVIIIAVVAVSLLLYKRHRKTANLKQ